LQHFVFCHLANFLPNALGNFVINQSIILMKKALIIYQSKKGTTKALAASIGEKLKSLGLETNTISADSHEHPDLSAYQYVFLGCWTKGLMVLGQHPDKIWQSFIRTLSIPETCQIGLFATYKIATGSMFASMRKNLPPSHHAFLCEIKSRNGFLSPKQEQKLLERLML
jgi:hypothetical protein